MPFIISYDTYENYQRHREEKHMFDLTGKVALITGASGGIGASIAKMLHHQGAIVAISGTRIEALQALQEELKERVELFPAHLGNKEAIENLIPSVEDRLGSLDILINNAGITQDGLLMRMKDEDWEEVLQINLGTVFRLCRSAIKGMMKRRYGRIINISSIVGTMGNAGQTNYAASKAGMIGFSKSLALEVASRSVTVNCIAPGFILTPMTDVLKEDQKQKLSEKIPLLRLGVPEDIAAAAVYLASNQASYVTGQTFHINGGMIMP